MTVHACAVDSACAWHCVRVHTCACMRAYACVYVRVCVHRIYVPCVWYMILLLTSADMYTDMYTGMFPSVLFDVELGQF